MSYKHRIVQGLADLIAKYGGEGKDPMMRAMWWGLKGQVPSILYTLDNNEVLVEEIRSKIMEMLELEKPAAPIEVKTEATPVVLAEATPEVKSAETLIVVEPVRENSGDKEH